MKKEIKEKKRLINKKSYSVFILIISIVCSLYLFFDEAAYNKKMSLNEYTAASCEYDYVKYSGTVFGFLVDERCVDKYIVDNEEIDYLLKNQQYAFTVRDPEVKLNIEAADKLAALLNDYKKETQQNNLCIINGYISKNDDAIKKINQDKIIDYISGLSVDIGIYTNNNYLKINNKADCAWLINNSCNYGFIPKFEDGYLHLRYVGYPHSVIMEELDLNLSSYIDFLKEYKYDENHLCYKRNEKIIEVFYVTKTGDTTFVPVFKNNEYTVSGNGEDGFVISRVY